MRLYHVHVSTKFETNQSKNTAIMACNPQNGGFYVITTVKYILVWNRQMGWNRFKLCEEGWRGVVPRTGAWLAFSLSLFHTTSYLSWECQTLCWQLLNHRGPTRFFQPCSSLQVSINQEIMSPWNSKNPRLNYVRRSLTGWKPQSAYVMNWQKSDCPAVLNG